MPLKTFAAFAVALFVAITASLATNALAQSTGGSFGGGSFGGGGSGSRSSGSSSSGSSHSYGGSGDDSPSYGGSSPSYGGSRNDDDSPSYGGSRPSYGGSSYSGRRSTEPFPWWIFFGAVVAGVFVAGISWMYGESLRRAQHDLRVAHEDAVPSPVRSVDVTAISLALDWRAREQIQKKLEALARRGNTSTPGALTHMLHETVVELRRAESAWLYAGAVSTHPTWMENAERIFRSVANEMRSRFRHELIRNAAGQIAESAAPELRAREAEGKGVVVVTVVVAAKCEIPDVTQASNAYELRAVLKTLGALAAWDLVALEVIWSPAAENDRMSTAELEAIYPELRKIREDTIAGRVFCGYCSGPFAAELDRCPHCGAPASDAAKRS